MKVILIKDVAKMGRKGQVVEVPSGHAINFLIPRKLAVPATTENMKRHTAESARRAEGDARTEDSFRQVVATLAQTPVTLHVEANAQGHLFKGIHAADIAARLNELGFAVSERAIVLEHPIKATGTHIVPLRQGGITGQCTLEISK